MSSKEQKDLILIMAPPWQTKTPPPGLAYLSSFLTSNDIKIKADLKTHKGILKSDNSLPSIMLESDPAKQIFLQLQNIPAILSGRMMDFCLLKNLFSEDYNKEGQYFKEGDILEGDIRICIK